jgi:hypothetical protein
MAEVGNSYRTKGLEIMARAKIQPDPQLRSELEELSFAYIKLAEHAERMDAPQYEGLTPRRLRGF